ncbi:hypothetical protein SAMN04487857_103226 [Pseudomonas sp. ok272]|uniref:hypothetical protein n=1 Tax=unclassified Pseudomonas TaxID=196821 RepID=UPI0008C6542D|nr:MULTISPECIES: hypothetical protein [unclassified Pseudomonas]SEM61659.1 hypothetical protein SAMN04487857_103226 [Pseudomonas sp. ok272]SFM48532.1 hypothetical protein SAMN04487858_103209 [Pseudomonas sp. ok602]
MYPRNRPQHWLALSLCLPLGTAMACGPDFPLRLLDDRAQNLSELPEGSFQFEVSRLGRAIAGLKPATGVAFDTDYSRDEDPHVQARNAAEQQGLSEAQRTRVAYLRTLQNPQQVLAEGADLPPELRLYTAGAVAFNIGQSDVAALLFRQVLALPAEQRALRSTWAAYSLGRTLSAISEHATALDAAGRQEVVQHARQAYRQARQLSIEGFSDPQELGIASLGEEARLARQAGDWNSAIELYASQNLQGSPVGYSSLKQLMNELGALPDDQLNEVLKGQAVQQLVTAALISHVGWSFGEQPPLEQKIIKALLQNTAGSLDNADRLAALNYQVGDYATTKTLLEHAGDGGLAWWLRAKMAVREGDKVAATSAYAKAAKSFPQDETWGYRMTASGDYETLKPGCRVEGESALLALERGDYLQAFEQLYRSQDLYWLDAAVVAERVLTVDELKQFVDSRVPAPAALTQQERDNYVPLPVAARLRDLLGRRLLREGRYDEAPAYFDNPQLQGLATEYGRLRQAADSGWWPSRRAANYFNAGWLARSKGMELLGYEMDPDYATFDGGYSLEAPAVVVAPLISAGEVQRQQASAAQPNERFHYRYVATGLASRAADLLPHSSQAFAAVLCAAAGWGTGVEEQRALYQRYVKEGPYVDWAVNFGHQCPYPDFQSADKRYVTQAVEPLRTALRPYKTWLQMGTVVGFTALALWLINRHKRRAGRNHA